jgi:protein-arginine kinase activator protein McsA|tara:strand:- start:5673 stop:6020 length:348 start_codon:yes stop_codon:yes gene_type:complete
MSDIFDNPILCRKCDRKMKKAKIVKNGFVFRAVVCQDCDEKIIHPLDQEKFDKFKDLKNKQFSVKMRLVGNSYAVSIPREIVNFMKQQEKVMDDMVRLCFEDLGRVSLNFNDQGR